MKIGNLLRNTKVKMTAGATAVFGSSFVAQAEDYTAQITTASTDGNANMLAVIGAVIALAIIGFGVGRMLGWFGR
jgi:hypothetical protein